MENFTIHVFGYGETQINSKEFSVKVASTELKKVKALIDAIWAKKPADSNAEESYHVINLFGHNDIRWVSKDGFELSEQEDLLPLIDDLIAELKTAYDSLPKEEEVV
jgi:hypothetical protein